jgi:hypothetical protein
MADENIYKKVYKNHRLGLYTPEHEFHKHMIVSPFDKMNVAFIVV